VVASVSKTKLDKYSIKAEIFDGGRCCRVKAKVYTQPIQQGTPQVYAVEFQRVSQDAFVFQNTYRLLVGFLEGRFPGLKERCGAKAPASPVASQLEELAGEVAQTVDDLEVLVPFLEMATIRGLEAEAAAGLCSIVQDGHGSAKALLAAPEEVATVFIDLLASAHSHTIYPVALCISGLSQVDEAGTLLAHPGLLQTAVCKVVSELETAHGIVAIELAKAIASAVQSCAESLSPTAISELEETLASALNNAVMASHTMAYSHLQEALFQVKLLQ